MHSPTSGSRRKRWIGVLTLIAIVGVSVVLRWPGLTASGFLSHDVAGILYNAMLLDHGMFPYVDSVELKAPGTFYLAHVVATPGGRGIGAFQLWANLVALASLVGVAGIAWRLWGL
ncbi:MAG: hypothetical protein ACPG4T_12295, partial [Nannocystaceae bacterium]